ncbi:MAG: EFR1 family ferrodoxin [Clostridia bacterium]|nr:EFR1 family ferrodoxin [Clostridia bacterium]
MKVCYFTATGNSLYVAKRIGGDRLSVPQLMKQDSIELQDDAVGIVCPVYGGEMPKMVRRFLKKAQIRTDFFFFIYTYGMNASAAKYHAAQAAKDAGIRLGYVASIKMVDNYLPGFEIRNQIETAGEKHIEEQIAAVRGDIEARKTCIPAAGLLQKIAMTLIHGTLGRAVLKDTAARAYMVNENCIRCGVCARVCPAGNIVVTDRVTFGDQCEDCYACVHNCPKNAIHLQHEKSTARFRNEHIALQEIMDANHCMRASSEKVSG